MKSGWVECRAAMAQTDKMSTGGRSPFLHSCVSLLAYCFLPCHPQEQKKRKNSPELSHITRFVQYMICLSINLIEEYIGKMLLSLLWW